MIFKYSKKKSVVTRWLTIAVATTIAVGIISGSGWGASKALAGSPTASNPVATCPAGGQCFADVTSGNPFYAFINRIYQQDLVSGYPCGGPGEACDGQSRPYYRPNINVTRQQMAKFIDNARRLPEIHIEQISGIPPIYVSNGNGAAILAYSTSSTGVNGASISEVGVHGTSDSGVGVHGDSESNYGVTGSSSSSYGIYGESTTSTGVYGTSSSGWAGYFQGNVNVTGTCCGASEATTRIDHPLDPASKYLNQSLVQSPDMLSVLSGNITTDGIGEATVALPDYFQASNGDFRYQLTVIGEFAQAIVSSKIKDNPFIIKTDKPNVEVSWQVTGVRHDPYAQQHPITVEQAKPAGEQGMYLHPELYNQPESKKIVGDQSTTPASK